MVQRWPHEEAGVIHTTHLAGCNERLFLPKCFTESATVTATSSRVEIQTVPNATFMTSHGNLASWSKPSRMEEGD